MFKHFHIVYKKSREKKTNCRNHTPLGSNSCCFGVAKTPPELDFKNKLKWEQTFKILRRAIQRITIQRMNISRHGHQPH